MPVRLARFGLPLLMAVMVLALRTGPSDAASAISVDKKNGAYGFCSGADDAWAALTCAEKKCRARGGRDCQVVDGCPTGGYGAIARDAKARIVGGACGMESEDAAKDAAMTRCGAPGRNCTLVESFKDGEPPIAAKEKAPGGGSAEATAKKAERAGKAAPGEPPEAGEAVKTEKKKSTAEAEKKPAAGAEKGEQAKGEEGNGEKANEALRKKREAMMDKLVGIWSSGKCVDKFWQIARLGGNRFRAHFVYEDGTEATEQFKVTWENQIMVLNWDTRLPQTSLQSDGSAPVRTYVEKVGSVTDASYTVIHNNYRNPQKGWVVHRCN